MLNLINKISKFIVDHILQAIGILINIPRPKIDISGINHLSDNQIVFNLVIFLHLLYIFLLNYCIKWDKIDDFMYKKVVQINDIPSGIYKYLVSIYTNWRPKSGTKSKIFLQLHGSLGQNTICYLLHNPFLPYREMFVWGDISFFVINTAYPVGDIQVSDQKLTFIQIIYKFNLKFNSLFKIRFLNFFQLRHLQ